jgi:hypothetical protein
VKNFGGTIPPQPAAQQGAHQELQKVHQSLATAAMESLFGEQARL